jgi:hypothetical protein
MDHRFVRPLGVLSTFVSVPLVEEGLRATLAFFQEGDTLRLFLSSIASAGGFLFLIGGALLFARRRTGRSVAYVGAAMSVVACTVGAVIGLVGGHGVLYGVGYPIAIVMLLRATPSNGLPVKSRDRESQASARREKGSLRSAIARTV